MFHKNKSPKFFIKPISLSESNKKTGTKALSFSNSVQCIIEQSSSSVVPLQILKWTKFVFVLM